MFVLIIKPYIIPNIEDLNFHHDVFFMLAS